MSTPDVQHDVIAHVAVAWVGVIFAKLGIHTWSDLAAVLASIYTLLMIGDWVWRKWVRKWARKRGWTVEQDTIT